MTLAVQRSLFESGGGTPVVESARWIEAVMLGEIALGVCIIAVAFIGALMLTGRLPLRDGARVVVGCFVLLGAPVIAAGFAELPNNGAEKSSPPPVINEDYAGKERNLPHTSYDPYSGV